jgi:hypothetical protein
MAKIGHNESCPCGTGKKYKRCCLAAQAALPELPPAAVNQVDPPQSDDDLCDCCLDALDERADRALDLILEGYLDEAETMAHHLMRDFPREVEGVDLLSMVSEARGERERAAKLLRRAIDIVQVHPYHDVETRVLMRRRLTQLEQRA